MFMRPTWPATLTIALVCGCDRAPRGGSAADEGSAVTVRDSAGIEIVENHAPEHTAGQFWTIDPTPEIVLGGEENPGGEANDSAQLIWSVVGVARLEDGRVAILSSEGNRFLLFEPSGKLSRTIGRAGEGPGEFTRPEYLQYLPPDTLVVWDYFMTSIIHFDTAGQLIGERSIDFATMMRRVPGATGEGMELPLPDGSFVASILGGEPEPELVPGTLIRIPGADIVRIDQEYAAYPLGTWEGMEFWVPRETVSDQFPLVPTFGPDFHIASGGRPPSIFISDGARDEVLQFALDGTLLRIIRRTTDPVPVTRETQSAWEATFFMVAEDYFGEPAPPDLFDGMPMRESFPPVTGLVVDAEGYLWVMGWSASESGMPEQLWSVFSPSGRWLGVPALPPDPLTSGFRGACHWRFSACWIDRDFFLTIRRDELGVERVEGYRIRRGD